MLKALALAAFALAPATVRAGGIPPLTDPPFDHALVGVGERVFVIGGFRGSGAVAEVRAFDGRGWQDMPSMSVPRYGPGAAALGGRLYVAGGHNPGVLASVESMDLRTGAWRPEPSLSVARHHLGLAVARGKLYAIGGVDPRERYEGVVEVLDLARGAWRRLAPMPVPRKGFALAVVDGKIYVFGGANSGGVRSESHVYDPQTDKWSALPPLPTARHAVAAAASGGVVYIAGGADTRGASAETLAFDTRTGAWKTLPDLPGGRDAAAGVFWRRCFLVLGGRSVDGDSSTPRFYAPDRNAWSDACDPALAGPTLYRVLKKASPDDFALIVGVERYRSLPDADHAEDDARLMREKALALGVPEENVVTLLGERAGKADLEKYLDEWLPKNLTPKSRLYVFFSGHGAPEPADGTTFLVPWDGDAAFLRSTAYPVKKLLEKLGALNAREVIVALDACFSGAGGRSVIAKGLRPLVHVQDPASAGPGKVIVFTASAADEVSGSDDEHGHGLFTYYFAKGLDGAADADKNGKLTVAELGGYVRAQVERSAHRQNREQHPQVRARDQSLRIY